MNIHKAIYTAREWSHGDGMRAFYLSGKVVNEKHRKSLINDIKEEQKWLADRIQSHDEKYGEQDEQDLANLFEVVQWAPAGKLLVKVPTPNESVIGQWND